MKPSCDQEKAAAESHPVLLLTPPLSDWCNLTFRSDCHPVKVKVTGNWYGEKERELATGFEV